MPVVISTLATGELLTASRLNGIFEEVQEYLNGNIDQQDMTSSAQITEREIVKPEFYGSPAPRALLATSDVHYRRELDYTRSQIYTNQMTTDFVPIPGLAASFYCEEACHAIVTATFNAKERLLFPGSGVDRESKTGVLSTVMEKENFKAAEFKLFVNGSAVKGTSRNLFISQKEPATPIEDLAGKNLSICCMVELVAGINDVSVQIQPKIESSSVSKDEFFHIYVSFRQMHVEALLK